MSLALIGDAGAASNLGPPIENGPVVVDIGFYLSGVTGVNEEEETIEFEGILTLRWHDPRQAFDPEEAGEPVRTFQGSYQFNEVYNGWWPQIILANEAGKYERQGVMLQIAPSGAMTYIEEIDVVAETRLALQRFPFDHQVFDAVFATLGFDSASVVLRANPTTTSQWDDGDWIRVPQWHAPSVSSRIQEYDPVYGGTTAAPTSAFVVSIGMSRDPGYMIRLVIFPLTVLVALSWSVFWMSRSSLGDRMDISFIGILSIVAYQITISGLMPKISYPTILSTYLIISFLMMCASVIVNLIIGRIDQGGNFSLGDRIDARCRIAFPLTYAVLTVTICGAMYWAG